MKKAIIIFIFITFIFTNIFNAQVFEEWVKRYNGSDSLFDAATAIDINNNVFVAGNSFVSSGENIVVLRYNPEGILLWSVSVEGKQPIGILVDKFGNSYVVGRDSTNSFLTFKINSIGEQQWTAIASGTGFPSSLALDKNNNIYITGSNSDTNKIVTVKYNTNGIQQWEKEFQNNSSTEPAKGKDIAVDENGNVYVTGFSHNGNSFDYTTIKYNTKGILLWFAYYDGSGSATDIANSIDFDNKFVYITGFSEGNNGSGFDYTTIKHNINNGGHQWIAIFNGSGNSTDIPKSIAVLNSKIYITGGSTSSSGNFDYTTIQYNANGTLAWAQLFNGPGNGNDFANALAIDLKGNICVTGESEDIGANSDFTTIQYDSNGKLLWLQRFNGTGNGFDNANAISLDKNSNVYVCGASFDSISGFEFVTIKYNQNIPKETQRLIENLKTLSIGLVNISKNDTIKQIVFQSSAFSVDEFANIRLDSLIAIAKRMGIDMKKSMNADICSALGRNCKQDYVSKILKDIKFKGHRLPVYIAIPHYSTFSSEQFSQDPFIAYSHLERNYPVPCANCPDDKLTLSLSQLKPSWVLVVKRPDWYSINGPSPVTIANCTSSQNPLVNNQCQSCPPPLFPSTGIPVGSGLNLMNHEIEINIGVNDGTVVSDNCLALFSSGYNINQSPAPGIDNYAQLSMIPGFTYYRRDTKFSPVIKIYKIPFAIIDRCNNPFGVCSPAPCPNTNQSCWAKEGEVLTLCKNKTLFNSWEEEVVSYGLGYGGVFKITRPGVLNQKALYFAFPYSRAIWFTQGPDMRVYYGVNDFSGVCPSGRKKIEEDFETRGCEFCTTAPLSIPYINTTNVTNFIASTDPDFIQNYWLDNVITIGFTSGPSAPVQNNNIRFFSAVASPPAPCSPSGTLIGQFTLGADGGYEIEKPLLSSVNPGTVLTIHIRANFINGESIDECQTLTINGLVVNLATVEIRGNIKNFNSSVINYQIDIYK